MPDVPPDHQAPQSSPAVMYDVFISYSAKDAAWVRGPLLQQLESHSLHVCLDVRDFRPGVARVEEMERAILTSRYTLIILTPHYLSSGWTRFERLMHQTLDADMSTYRLIPVLKTPCTLPISIGYLTYVDFTDPQQVRVAWNRLLTALDPTFADRQMAQLPLDNVPDPTFLPPGSRMSLSPNPLFVGRENELRTLARVLKVGDTAAIGQIAAATGLGGIGKTQLAVEFVHRYGQFFPGGVFWLTFAGAQTVPAEIAACGGLDGMRLSPVFDQFPLDKQVHLVLAAWQSPLPRLLVFDNCEDEGLLNDWRPKHGGCRVLVTSRHVQWDATLGVHALRLGVLPRTESIALLRAFRPDLADDDPDLDAIATELGDLPLALHLAGNFLKRYRQDMTPQEYLDELRATTGIAHESLEGAGISPTQHDLSVAQTFRISYDRLDVNSTTDALALSMLARAAHFAPGEAIPRNLLQATLNVSADERYAKRRVTRSIRRVGDLGLVEEDANGSVRLHRLVAAFVRQAAPDTTAQQIVEHTMLGIADALNAKGYPAPLLVVQPHLRFITEAAKEREDEQAAKLCTTLGQHLQVLGDYEGARIHHQHALAIRKQVVGMEHPDTASSLNNVGEVLCHQGEYAVAQGYFEHACAIRERVYGAEAATTAESLNDLGFALHGQEKWEDAQHYYARALAIRERVLGMDHPDTALSLNNLGAIRYSQGDWEAAHAYYARALVIWEQQPGEAHPHMAGILNNVGVMLRDRGAYEEAESYFRRVLTMREGLLEKDHPDTAMSLNGLGELLYRQGKIAEAQGYLERALVIRQRALGMMHLDTARSLYDIGMVLGHQGDGSGARNYLKQAYTIREQRLGSHHPDTQAVRDALTSLDAESSEALDPA